MKNRLGLVFAIISCLIFAALPARGEEDKIVYQTFVNYVKNGEVESVTFPESILEDLTVTIKKGGHISECLVDLPHALEDDVVFLDFLKKNGVPSEVFENEIGSLVSGPDKGDKEYVKIPYQTFINYVESGQVALVEFPKYGSDIRATVTKNGDEVAYLVDTSTHPEDNPVFLNFLSEHKVTTRAKKKDFKSMFGFGVIWRLLLVFAIPLGIILLLLIFQIIIMIRISKISRTVKQLKEKLPDSTD